MRFALVGCGAIGAAVIRAFREKLVEGELVAVYDLDIEKAKEKAGGFRVVESLEELILLKPDIAIEAASQEFVKSGIPKLLENGISVILMSVGALLDPETASKVRKSAEAGNSRVYVPHGAIAGIDAIQSLRLRGIEKVFLRTRKNPKSLGVKSELKRPAVLFSGSAKEAVKLFPANINVAASLALAAGVEPVVEILADPNVQENVHEITVESKVSKIVLKIRNSSSLENPKTSEIAALSVISALRKIAGNERIIFL